MTSDELKNIYFNIDTSKKSIDHLSKQMEIMNTVYTETIDGLDGEQKQQIILLKAMTNRAVEKAKRGENFEEVLDKMKDMFKNYTNGGNSNG